MLLLFAALAIVHLTAIVLDASLLETVSKALLMPSLALWLHLRQGPKLMTAGLLLSAVGDIALSAEGFFLVGMAFFALAHVCYMTYFLRNAARPKLPVIAGYAVVWLALLAFLWPGLGALQIPIALYSLLLTTTAVTSTTYGLRAGIGGALFLLSDTLIAVRLADHDIPLHGVWVMSTYIAAQYLLASATRSTPRPVHTRAP